MASEGSDDSEEGAVSQRIVRARNAPAAAPPQLRALWPLVLRFGVSDDAARARALGEAPYKELAGLVDAVDADAFAAINRYLDETGNSAESVPFGDLAQAATEAAQVLAARSGTSPTTETS